MSGEEFADILGPDEVEEYDAITDEERQALDDGIPWFPEENVFDDFIDTSPYQEVAIQQKSLTPSLFTATAFRIPNDEGVYAPFSFEGRRHMKTVYDTPARRILLCCARQVEKCGSLVASVTLSNGRIVQARDIATGNRVVCLDMLHGVGTRFTDGKVVWVSPVRRKKSYRITTRQGHELDVAGTHPVRVWGGWRKARDIRVGDRVAAVRRAGSFGVQYVDPCRVELTAFMLGDGGLTQPQYTYTQQRGLALQRFRRVLKRLGHTWRDTSRNGAAQVFIHRDGPLYEWMLQDQLHGKYSHEKEVPHWVFDLDKKQTALFLNRLWSTDGHNKQDTPSKYSFEYCSTSRALVRQVQSLLWKFGIPSSIRENQPSYVCTSGELARKAYILRIETQSGVRKFLKSIGALGKTEGLAAPTVKENNNRDTLPIEINELLRRIIATNPKQGWGNTATGRSLRSAGLRETLEYPPTQQKLRRYVEFFRRDAAYDPELVRELEAHVLDNDVYWDVVESIECLGKIDCVDFEVEDHHNFLIDGVVTHNSTFLGNSALAYSCLVPGYRTMYVSPSATQTKTFSVDRIKEPIETSDVLRAYTTTMLSQNVFEKQFVNRSKITLRYAFLSADRTRGIPCWRLMIDELQDILSDNIPVIEQSTSHAPPHYKSFVYAGTPKSLGNTIEVYRSKRSTQGEWVVPCDRCGSSAGAGRYWNVLGEANIDKRGLVCARCRKPINPMHPDARWARMVKNADWESYRVPQLMVPWKPWSEILYDYNNSARDRFYNEVLGISYDSGIRPITQAQLIECCNPDVRLVESQIRRMMSVSRDHRIYAGIDWGGGEHSYTVLVLGMFVGRTFRIFYMHRFTGEDISPELQMSKIIPLLHAFNVRRIGADYGGGQYGNDKLFRAFGKSRVARYHYAAKLRKKIEWKGQLQRFLVYRTEIMSDIFNALKRHRIELPAWDDIKEPYGSDILGIFSEYNEQRRETVYKHEIDNPDDTFHAILYCVLAAMIDTPMPDIISPNRERPGVFGSVSSYTGPTNQY